MKNLFLLIRCIAVAVLITGTLSACGIVRQQQQQAAQEAQQAAYKAASEQAQAALKECHDKHESGELKTHVALVKCSSSRIIEAWQNTNYPNIDLLELLEAARLQGAENIDKGKVTEAEANLQLAELRTRVKNEERRRNLEVMQAQNQATIAKAAASQARAANTAATGNFLQGLAALQPRAPAIRSTNCTGVGNSVNCTTVGQ